ncbi:winged-helix domain-containing protein [Bifidobacterium sp. 82T24]|uniref:winged helix family transcriptional regulator n=1 Tax=Bifidobacterium pluvialisilvae TaxID=2834436 RepID=UPI001C561790|nr:winged helix-turn-helix domain-containing protein [Bifidobacterium pluvialisilvae]MBW3088958.1 winged-helix domain-containing protein [Bifidobacterium pluvialisilvae]
MDILLAAGGFALRNALATALAGAHHRVIALPLAKDEVLPDVIRVDLVIVDDAFPVARHPDQWDVVLRHAQTSATMLLESPSLGRSNGTGAKKTDAAASIRPNLVLDKPFSDAQLLAYVRMAVSQAHAGKDNPLLSRGGLVLDTESRQAFYGDSSMPIALSPREYGALEALLEADGRYLSFDELLERVCGNGTVFEQRDIMTTVMYRLMGKMRRAGLFITKHGDRYRIG